MATPDLTHLRARMKRELDIATKRRELDAASPTTPSTSEPGLPWPQYGPNDVPPLVITPARLDPEGNPGATREELATIVAEETERPRWRLLPPEEHEEGLPAFERVQDD